jgi:hypothetical protein
LRTFPVASLARRRSDPAPANPISRHHPPSPVRPSRRPQRRELPREGAPARGDEARGGAPTIRRL